MFSPNLMGSIQRLQSRDIHGRHVLSDPVKCPFGPVSLNIGAVKTSVRADSSASRGSANQISVEAGSILISKNVGPKMNDIFTFSGVNFEITSVHERYSVDGFLDHYQCDLETYVQ